MKYAIFTGAALISAMAIYKALKNKLPEREYSESDEVWVL